MVRVVGDRERLTWLNKGQPLSAFICKLSWVYYISQSIFESLCFQKGFKATSFLNSFSPETRGDKTQRSLLAHWLHRLFRDMRLQAGVAFPRELHKSVCEAAHNHPKGGRAAAQIKGDAWQRADNKQPHPRGAAPGQS